MIETKYYLDWEGLTKTILQLSEIIQSKTSNLVSLANIKKFATIKTILDTNLSIGLNEDGSHIKTEGKFTDKAETITEEISALDTELYSLKETVDASVNIDNLSLVAITGDYNDLSNKPVIPSVGDAEIEIQKNGTKINSFTTNQKGSKVNINITVPTGTAADKNIPSSGDASSTEVVMGNDTRLSDSRPASDVYSWAKAKNKPSYEKSEIGLENVTNDAQIKRTEMGVASGVATLDSAGKVPSSQLPNYVTNIDGIIPSLATSTNQLADKNFVNSSISTSTATFRGTSATKLTEQQFLTWANGLTKDDNDYVFWNTVDSDGNIQFKRYKYDGTQWVYEYTLNNSSFTSAQLAAIQSGITSNLVDKLTVLPTNADLTIFLGNKADKTATVSSVSYDTTNKKIQETINGTTTDVVTASTIVTDGGGITTGTTYTVGSNTYTANQLLQAMASLMESTVVTQG